MTNKFSWANRPKLKDYEWSTVEKPYLNVLEEFHEGFGRELDAAKQLANKLDKALGDIKTSDVILDAKEVLALIRAVQNL